MRSLVSQLSIHKLEVFCAFVELGTVSRAAARLGIAQPVVSSHLKSLTRKLGAPLTVRKGRRLALTETGDRVYSWAREIVSRTRELEREVACNRIGIVGKAVLGASMTVGSYVLPRLIVGFLERYPQSEVSVRISSPQSAIEALEAGDCDFAFTILDPRQQISGFDVALVRHEELILVASPDMPIPRRLAPRTGLPELPFVSAEAGSPRREIEERLLGRAGVRRGRAVLELGHAEALKQAVRAGAGVAFLFRSSVREELAMRTLLEIEVEGVKLETPIYCIRRGGKQLSPYQEKLLNELSVGIRQSDLTQTP